LDNPKAEETILHHPQRTSYTKREIHQSRVTTKYTTYFPNISHEFAQKFLNPIDVGWPSRNDMPHVMLNDGALVLLKHASQFGACPARNLSVMTFTAAKAMERGKPDWLTVQIADRCWISRAEHPKPELRRTASLLLPSAQQGSHCCTLGKAKNAVEVPILSYCAFKVCV
jgi:hypothetical protein